MLSKSRTMTATWARLAASATSVKSLRKASVEGAPIGAGAGTGIVLDVVGDCCVADEWEEADCELKVEVSILEVILRSQ